MKHFLIMTAMLVAWGIKSFAVKMFAASSTKLLFGSAIVPTVISSELQYTPPYSLNPVRQLDPSQQHGRVRSSSFTYTFAGTETTASIIRACNIPKNSRILRITAWTSGSTGTSTFNFGLIARDGLGQIDDGKTLPSIQSAATLSGADTVTASPVADNATFFGAIGASTSAQGPVVLADTIAHNVGYVTVRDCQLIISVATASITLTPKLFGFVEYVTD